MVTGKWEQYAPEEIDHSAGERGGETTGQPAADNSSNAMPDSKHSHVTVKRPVTEGGKCHCGLCNILSLSTGYSEIESESFFLGKAK